MGGLDAVLTALGRPFTYQKKELPVYFKAGS